MYDIDRVLIREMQEEDELDTILDSDGDLIDLVDSGADIDGIKESADIFNKPIIENTGKELFI